MLAYGRVISFISAGPVAKGRNVLRPMRIQRGGIYTERLGQGVTSDTEYTSADAMDWAKASDIQCVQDLHEMNRAGLSRPRLVYSGEIYTADARKGNEGYIKRRPTRCKRRIIYLG